MQKQSGGTVEGRLNHSIIADAVLRRPDQHPLVDVTYRCSQPDLYKGASAKPWPVSTALSEGGAFGFETVYRFLCMALGMENRKTE